MPHYALFLVTFFRDDLYQSFVDVSLEMYAEMEVHVLMICALVRMVCLSAVCLINSYRKLLQPEIVTILLEISLQSVFFSFLGFSGELCERHVPERDDYLRTGCEEHPEFCALRFADGTCNEECNNEKCFFDGFDCVESTQKCR